MNVIAEREKYIQIEEEKKQRDFEERRALSVKPAYHVYKANPLLMVRENLNIMQARFFTAYLCKVNPADPSTYKVRFSLAEFCKTLEVDTVSIMRLKEDCSALRQTGFDFIEYRRKHGEKLDPLLMDEVSLFERFAIVGDYETGYYVEVTPTRPMEHLLADKERYGFVKYEAKNVLALSTKRHMRMYELFKRHEGNGFNIRTDLLKSYFNMSISEYPDIDDFQRKVLKKGIKEINEKTDISVSYIPEKRGRGGRIVGFRFTVKKNPVVVVDVPRELDDEPMLQLSEADIRDFNSDEIPETPVLDVPSDEPKEQVTFTDLASSEPERIEYVGDYRPEVIAQFRALETIIPKDVHEGKPEHVAVIHSMLKDYVPLHYLPGERLAFMMDTIDQFHNLEWVIKKSKTRTTYFSHYKSCLGYWLKDHKQESSSYADDVNYGLPEDVLRRGWQL